MTQRAPLLPHTRIAAGARLLTVAQLQQLIGLALALTCGAYVLRQLHAGTAHAAVLVPSGGSRPHALATGGSVASVASVAGGGARGSGSATSLAGGTAAVAAGLGAGAAPASGAHKTPSAGSQSLLQPAAASSAARGSGTSGEAAGAARAGAAAAAAAASNVAARVAAGGAPSAAADAPPLELVVGVFITQNTRSDLIQAFRDGAAAFNAGLGPPAAARAVLVFFVGSTSHPLKQSEAGGAPDIVAGAFAENMNQCTFCSIPGFRGKFRSKPWAALLDEARRLVADGALELNLIAEDTNQWGQDRRDGRNLATLLRELSQIEGLRWIRLLYCYPSYFTDDLIEEIATNDKVCKYIDMPLQHINNMVLLAMNRPPQDHTTALLAKLRERIPGLALRTTFISGFPGETREQHRELVDFVRAFKFERMGCFVYSEEDGTPAASLPEQIEPDVRQQRRDELVSLQQRVSEGFAGSLVGRELDVLVDGLDDEGGFIGRTQWDAPDVDPIVFLAEAEDAAVARLEVGQMRRVRVDGASLFDLDATVVA